jgi:predicted nucleotidyltransferase
VRELLEDRDNDDLLEERVVRLLRVFGEAGLPLPQIGLTGSFLVGAHGAESDIDLVLYDTQLFHRARRLLAELVSLGRLESLNDAMWRTAYRRRGCSLSLDDYVWHERRKSNKAVFENVKVDLSLVVPHRGARSVAWRKLGKSRIQARVTDDRDAYDYPSRLRVEHRQVGEVVSYTPTYTGQACVGEWIEAAGFLEESEEATRRIVIGTSREAAGQYVRVLRES